MDRAFVALDDRLVVAAGPADAGADWTASEYLVGTQFECLATGPDRTYAGTVESGLLVSEDGGETWTELGEFDDRVTAVTVSPHDPEDLWVGTEPSRVYRSTDAGETWTVFPKFRKLPSSTRWSFPPRPHTHHVRWLEEDQTQLGRLYVAVEAGAFVRAEDSGERWHDHPRDARRDNHTIRTHPDAPGRVYVAAGDGYAESPDRGDTWDYPQAGLDHRYVWGLAVDPGDPDRVFVSAAAGARTAHDADRAEAYLYRREADGNWESVGSDLTGPGSVRAVLAAPRPGVVLAATNSGLFRSRDAGDSWEALVPWWHDLGSQRPHGMVVS
jgi:photosystem II stability/assembly factor-like uncharacterized protein